MDKDIERFDSSRFKPMTEGLGLNHFADGLPYTPVAQRRAKPMVQFNFPPPRAPRQQASTTEIETATATEAENFNLNSASFIRRIMAFAFDTAFAAGMFALIVWASFALNGLDIAEILTSRRGVQMFWPLVLLYVVVHMGYFLIQETTWRRTLGKAIFGIRIVSNSGFATVGRAACFFISAIPFGIGLLWYFFDSKHRCWHDVITDTEVVTG